MAKKKQEKMTEDDLASICDREFDQSKLMLSEIQSDRIKGLDAYNQEKYGNEEDGLSSYVSSDVSDAIEWIMPQLVDVFVGGDTPIMFTPDKAQDAPIADAESKYCQYVFERENQGVITTAIWFKDALMQKNGIVKAYWDEPVVIEREEYKGKTGQEYIALQNDPEYTVDECSIFLNEREFSEDEYASILGALPTEAAAIEQEAKYHIVGYRKKTCGQAKIENVPPENFFVQKDHNSIFLKDAKYCCEVSEHTRSDLVEMGYNRDLVDSLPAGDIVAMTDEKWTRNKKEGGMPVSNIDSSDSSRGIIAIFDHYIRADFNNDGIAELRHVRTVGRGNQKNILENEEVDRNIYHAITPYLRSYKFHGESVADKLVSLQRAKSQLWRTVFDNTMYSTMPRKVISGNVDVDALLTYVPGGVIQKDANATVENEITPFVANEVFPILDRMDGVRAERTGFSRDSMGLDPTALANSTTPVGMAILAQSQLLVKMIATIFAHSGFQSLMEHIRELVYKYEKEEKVFDLTGQNDFKTVDPRSWRKKRSSVPKVGIGFAGKNEELSLMTQLMTMQQQFVMAQGGVNGALTNAGGIYNTAKRMAQRMGVKDVSNYFQDPATYKPPAPQPSLAEVQMKASIENMNNQQKMKESDQSINLKKMQLDHDFKLAELSQKERISAKEIESRESIAHAELLYRYGHDAKEMHHVNANKDSDRKMKEKEIANGAIKTS